MNGIEVEAEVPTSPELVTSSWLTEVLRQSNVLDQAAVRSFKMQRIGADAGFTGQVVRFELDYTALEEGLPQCLVGKFGSVSASGNHFSPASDEVELGFYGLIGARIGLPVPDCFFYGMNSAEGTSILLLEDLSRLQLVDPVEGCSVAQAELVVQHLARMHASWWESPQLKEMGWVSLIDHYGDYPFADWWQVYPKALYDLLPDIDLPPAFLEVSHAFGGKVAEVFKPLATSPVTCIHRDTHAGNMFFGSVEGESRLVLFDWQLLGRGRGVSDITYFLTSSMLPEQRRELEERLLKMYYDLLFEGGVRGYSYEQCWADYRRSVFGKLLITVMATVCFDNNSTARRAWRRADLERLLAFFEDHALEDFL